jgi:hypothetical protein
MSWSLIWHFEDEQEPIFSQAVKTRAKRQKGAGKWGTNRRKNPRPAKRKGAKPRFTQAAAVVETDTSSGAVVRQTPSTPRNR